MRRTSSRTFTCGRNSAINKEDHFYKDTRKQKGMQYLCGHLTRTYLHRIGTGLSTNIDTSGDKQSKITGHDIGRMHYSPFTSPRERGRGILASREEVHGQP